jgi:hypothetical protein
MFRARFLVGQIAVLGLAFAVAGLASAQQQPATHIRGEIEAVQGNLLTVKGGDGQEMKVKLADKARITGIIPASRSDIKQGAYVGVSSVPQAEGPAKALEVHIFPANARGVGEGSTPFDLAPQSTMTNAAISERITAASGETITLKYKDGEKTVLIPPETPIVTFTSASMADLKPGAKISIFRATKTEGDTYEATSIQVGLNGLTPPT